MQAYGLETGGWVFLLASWLGISGLVLFCVRRILESAERQENDSPEDPGSTTGS